MRIKDLLVTTRDIPSTEAMALIGHVLGSEKEDLLRNMESDIDDATASRIRTLVSERKEGRPMAYIIGHKEFFSEPLYVDERVLIPRPETELLVEEALKILKKKPGVSYIMDMGAGSGAIGVILAKRALSKIFSVDVSPGAISAARDNGRRLGVLDKIHFLCSDLFSGIRPDRGFDMIVANLPYVAAEKWDRLMVDVRLYEPRLALDGGRRGLEIYWRFIAEAPRYLKKDGQMLCEIDGPIQAEKIGRMLCSQGLTASAKKDISGRERVVIGSWIDLS